MPWPKGYTKAQIMALPEVDRKALFKPAPKAATEKKSVPVSGGESAPVRPDHTEIPPNLFDGQHKSLEVMGRNGSYEDPIPGFKLYWFIDRDSGTRLSLARRSGYEFVSNEEVVLNDNIVSGNDDLGGHVRKFSKEVLDSKPVYLYLMKKPKWLADRHADDFEKIHVRQEAELRAGRISTNAKDGQYRPGQIPGSNLPKIESDTKLYR
jgi:hypothetical protein